MGERKHHCLRVDRKAQHLKRACVRSCAWFRSSCCQLLAWTSDSLQICVTMFFQVKVILGEDREATGILLSIDGDDGIVRMELDDQLKILNLRFLGRLEH